MSIATAITNLTNDRANIRTALVNQGITEASGHGFSSFAADIAAIEGGTSAYAFILATYPEGSTITCTKDSTTASSKAISTTKELFYITEAGTWTITITNSADSASQDVEITEEGQAESITISFKLILYNNGDLCTGVSGGWIDQYDYWASYNNGKVNCTVTNEPLNKYLTVTATGYYCGFYFGVANEIDLTDISTLTIDVLSYSGDDNDGYFCVHSSGSTSRSTENAVAKVNVGHSSSAVEKTLDVSSLSGSYALGFRFRVGNNMTSTFKLTYLGE